MSKTTIIILAVVALIIIIVLYSMYKSAQAKALAAQQQALYGTTSQKVNVAEVGNFIGGLFGSATKPATTTTTTTV